MGYGMDNEDWGGLADDHFEQQEAEQRFWDIENKRSDMRERYVLATNAETGATIRCPFCNKAFVKNTYNKMFCSNARTHKKNNCKDRYWNFVPAGRSQRSIAFNKGI